MRETDSGLVRYRGRLMRPQMVWIYKAQITHHKARKYIRKGVDPATVSPTVGEVERLGPDILKPEARARWDELRLNPIGPDVLKSYRKPWDAHTWLTELFSGLERAGIKDWVSRLVSEQARAGLEDQAES
jgi:hypothetical protein